MEYSFAWAHARGITTLFPQKDARLYDPITREELAKMISQYLINVQHRELVLSEDSCDDFADLSQASRDLQDDIIRVCQL